MDRQHNTSLICDEFGECTSESDVGNAFGGPIYVAIPAGSEFGEFNVTISGAVMAPMFVLNETSDFEWIYSCLLYTSPSPRDDELSRMPSSA